MRSGRGADEMRAVTLEAGTQPHADGSCTVSFGNTRVLCTASVEDAVPRWREASGLGWVTAEYGMLPTSTHSRRPRERSGAGGRTREIERLIGRALRSIIDFDALGPRTATVDCDVLRADGGTRTASITGGCVALCFAFDRLFQAGAISRNPAKSLVAAVSVGLLGGDALLDLDYVEDSSADVDLNVVATGEGRFVEVQGTAEGEPFSRDGLDRLLDLGLAGIETLVARQRDVLGERAP